MLFDLQSSGSAFKNVPCEQVTIVDDGRQLHLESPTIKSRTTGYILTRDAVGNLDRDEIEAMVAGIVARMGVTGFIHITWQKE